VAGIARDQGALTIAVVTKPFEFEGSQRQRVADAAATELAGKVDALIVVPNDRVGDVLHADASVVEAFGVVDDVLLHAVEGIIDLIAAPGLINLDFADVRSVMKDAGPALIGIGRGSGEHRAADAARQAIASPLLEARLEGARGILFNVSGPANLRLGEVREAADRIREHADKDANIIFGASFTESLGEEVLVTLMATGLNGHAPVPAVAAEVQPVETPVADLPAPIVEPKASPKRPARSTRKAAAAAAVASSPQDAPEAAPSATLDEDDFDVPSFLRRRTQGGARPPIVAARVTAAPQR
jgi:cell division protein FtsZ